MLLGICLLGKWPNDKVTLDGAPEDFVRGIGIPLVSLGMSAVGRENETIVDILLIYKDL